MFAVSLPASWRRRRRFLTRVAAVTATATALISAMVVPAGYAAPSGVIGRDGTVLTLNGAPYTFTGVNAYELATDWGSNFGCGADVFDLGSLFATLRPNSLVRFDAFQEQATNPQTGARDWAGLDRVFAAAVKYHQRLIPVIGSNWEGCDGAGKDTSWYAGGYETAVQTDPDGNPLPSTYWAYLQQLVERYADSPALGLWEPVGEPEVACGSVAVLRSFFDTVGGEIHALDPAHLVDSGTLSDEQCGLQGSDYTTVTASPGVDVASYHDYNSPDTPMPASLARVIADARSVDKPVAVFEGGMDGGASSGCTTEEQRATLYKAKMKAYFPAGVSGFLPWNWQPPAAASCGLAIIPKDPTLTLLHDFAL